jgi:acyl-CoA reductase-like NAD-dependent aldehyde dehydrogenase
VIVLETVAWPIQARLAWVRNWRRLIVANTDTLVSLVQHEVRKPEGEALTGDVMPLLASCTWHEQHATKLLAPRSLRSRPLWLLGQRHQVTRPPVGTVAIIATWNYPVQLLGIQLLQALVAGNRVVVKPSENAPRTQAYLLKLAIQAGLPEGQLRWTPATRDAGPRLLASERFDHVIFTGSTRVGTEVAAWAASTLTPTTLELSGDDSAIVLADADTKLAARSIWQAVTMNSGQTCMAPRRAIVSAGAYPSFVASLSFLAAGAKAQPLIDTRSAGLCRDAANAAIEAGGRSILGVDELNTTPSIQRQTEPRPRDEASFRAMAIVDMPESSIERERSIFGSLLLVYPASDDAHALKMHARCRHRLNTAIFTRDVARARTLAPQLGSGFVTINDAHIPTAHPGASITGTGASGWGPSRGELGLLSLTRPVVVSTSSALIRTPTNEPNAKELSILRRALRWLYQPSGEGRRIAPDEPISDNSTTPPDHAASNHAHASNHPHQPSRLPAQGPAR